MALEGHLWEKPATPHAFDDEFENTVLDPSWINPSAGGLDTVTPIDPYTTITPGRVHIHTSHRRSWLTSQYYTDWFQRSWTLPTNFLMWARMRFDRRGSKATGNQQLSIGITATTAGLRSTTNAMYLALSEYNSGERVVFDKFTSGAYSEIGATDGSLATRVKCIEYVMIHKVGSTFHGWCMGQSGEKIYIGSTTFAGDETLDRIGFALGGNATIPGSPIQGIDFFRVVESATYLP